MPGQKTKTKIVEIGVNHVTTSEGIRKLVIVANEMGLQGYKATIGSIKIFPPKNLLMMTLVGELVGGE